MARASSPLTEKFWRQLQRAVEDVILEESARVDVADGKFKARVYRLDHNTPVRIDIRKNEK